MTPIERACFAWKLYSPVSVFWGAHQTIRSLMIPLDRIVERLPDRGRVVDLGCGNGLFLALAKTARPALQLTGIDMSEGKIQIARAALGRAGIETECLDVQTITSAPEADADVFVVLDVMYLIPWDEWLPTLQGVYRALRPGGTLLLKEMDRSATLKFALIKMQETLAVKMLGLTLGSHFTFPSRLEIGALMEEAGFRVEEILLHKGHYIPHCLWVGTK